MNDDNIIEIAKQALNKIAWPINYLQEEAEKSGKKLDNSTVIEISENPTWLRNVAKNALDKISLLDAAVKSIPVPEKKERLEINEEEIKRVAWQNSPYGERWLGFVEGAEWYKKEIKNG